MSAGARGLSNSAEQQVQGVLADVAARVEQLELTHRQERAIVEHVFDDSHVALLRAIHSADFIQRLIEITPSLTEKQHQELQGLADELIRAARRVPDDASDEAKLLLRGNQEPERQPDLLGRFVGWVRASGDTKERKPDLLDDVFRWLRG